MEIEYNKKLEEWTVVCWLSTITGQAVVFCWDFCWDSPMLVRDIIVTRIPTALAIVGATILCAIGKAKASVGTLSAVAFYLGISVALLQIPQFLLAYRIAGMDDPLLGIIESIMVMELIISVVAIYTVGLITRRISQSSSSGRSSWIL